MATDGSPGQRGNVLRRRTSARLLRRPTGGNIKHPTPAEQALAGGRGEKTSKSPRLLNSKQHDAYTFWYMKSPDVCATLLRMSIHAFWRVIYLCLLEARPMVLGIFALRFLTGASFGAALFDPWVWVAVLLWVFTTWTVYLLNGVADVEEDRVNLSGRPIARGRLGAAEATVVVCALGGASLLGSLALSPVLFYGTVVALALGLAYSLPPLRLKRRAAGLAAVGLLAGLVTYYTGYAAGRETGNGAAVVAFAIVMSLWMALVGQTKDFPDVRGDEEAGRRSLPIIWGERAARLVLSGTAPTLGLAFLLAAIFLDRALLVPAVIVAAGSVAVTISMLVPWAGARDAARPYKFFMMTQYGAHLAVIIFGAYTVL